MMDIFRKTRRTAYAAAAVLLGCALLPLATPAQVASYGEKQTGDQYGNELPTVLKSAAINQRLNGQIPLNSTWTDETGKSVHLGDYFQNGKPAILALVYYQCPMLCSEELDGLTQALAMVHLNPGKDFQVVIASIDPSDTPAMAEQKKALYTKRYARPGTEAGWHFLVGPQPSIDALSSAVGFGYVRVPGPDGKLTQFAHASAIQILTPEGKVAQYYLGVEYSPKDVLLGLVEASGNKIGSPVANILTYCYHYDPHRNRHSIIVARVVQLSGMVTLAGLGGFMFLMFRRDHQIAKEQNHLTRRSDPDRDVS
ncbi:SCO family protein [Terriglobus aquaticus]|uniref:SCO family protein n=2 Tax=Terriglobus aquaticus TaxID=940139 RepID=A0ABW9KFR1_9BACT